MTSSKISSGSSAAVISRSPADPSDGRDDPHVAGQSVPPHYRNAKSIALRVESRRRPTRIRCKALPSVSAEGARVTPGLSAVPIVSGGRSAFTRIASRGLGSAFELQDSIRVGALRRGPPPRAPRVRRSSRLRYPELTKRTSSSDVNQRADPLRVLPVERACGPKLVPSLAAAASPSRARGAHGRGSAGPPTSRIRM